MILILATDRCSGHLFACNFAVMEEVGRLVDYI